MDTGNVKQSTTPIILFILRMVSRFDSYLSFLLDYNDGQQHSASRVP